jgi:hypothetical protein
MKNELEISRQESQHPNNPAAALEIHVVDKNDIFYPRGRLLARSVYKHKWKTENLVDSNDYGIVIISEGRVIANMNIQMGSSRPLKSEKFFSQKHWKHYFDVPREEMVEISGLSIDQNVDSDLRYPLIMLLSLTAYNLTRSLGVKVWTTVQLKVLNRILTKRLHLPFFTNEFVRDIQGQVPNDNYWNGVDMPKLYYLDLASPATIDIFNSFFSYLNLLGIKTSFLPRYTKTSYPSFSSFRQTWS